MPPACRFLAALGASAWLLASGSARADTLPACTESGIASYYGPGFHGRPTASGEIFDSMAMTAAHPTLPLGTAVEVRRVGGGPAIDVTINDRGPYIDGRIIDLSEAAAAALGMIEEGIVPVTVAIYVENQGDPDIRMALLAMSGTAVRRPSLQRLEEWRAEILSPGWLCPASAQAPEATPRNGPRILP